MADLVMLALVMLMGYLLWPLSETVNGKFCKDPNT